MTLARLSALLDTLGLPHAAEQDHLWFSFSTRAYRTLSGEPKLRLQLALEEEGRLLVVLAPEAFSVAGRHAGTAYRACTLLMWQLRLVRFHADFPSGLVQALVEVPVEDGTLTAAQLRRCLTQLVEVLEHAYPAVHRAATEGVLDVQAGGRPLCEVDLLSDVFANTPPDVVADALYRADQRLRGE